MFEKGWRYVGEAAIREMLSGESSLTMAPLTGTVVPLTWVMFWPGDNVAGATQPRTFLESGKFAPYFLVGLS